MEIAERDLPFATWAADMHDRIERSQRDAHIAGMSGNALVALAENGVSSIITVECPAATTRLAFVTRRKRRVVKIIATCPLHQISSNRCHVAQLGTGAGE